MSKRFQLAKFINIEGRMIGEKQPVFIIAEIGINHNGDPALAKKMIDAASTCGADCVKFQIFRAEEFMADKEMTYEYKFRKKSVRENMFSMFKRMEFGRTVYESLFEYARKRKVIPLASVADPLSADIVEGIGAAAFKLSSEDLINLPLVECVIKKFKPVIFSTGMADKQELSDVLNILRVNNFNQAIFLHCVSLYPCAASQAHLLRIRALAKRINGIIGYSDHTQGIISSIGAVALGASVIEKHFTLDRNLPGPDQSFSADPKEMKELIKAIREMEIQRGEESLDFSLQEIAGRKSFRRSIVASRDLPKGHILKLEDLALKRPGKGLRGREIPKLLGKKLKAGVSYNQPIFYNLIRVDL